MDINNDFYMVKFNLEEDMSRVIEEFDDLEPLPSSAIMAHRTL